MAAGVAKKRKLQFVANEWYLSEALVHFKRGVRDAVFVDFITIPGTPTPASQLTASELSRGEHFYIKRLNEDQKREFLKRFVQPVFDAFATFLGSTSLHLQECITTLEQDILINQHALHGAAENEAEVRFSVADPVVRFVTKTCSKLKVRLEYGVMDVVDNVPLPPCASARHSSAVPDTPGTPPMVTKRPFDTTTPGSAAKMAVSTRSRLDYAIVFNKRVPGVEESVSCLFETKFKLDVNAYAQAIGYYVAIHTSQYDPGVACIISEDMMHLIVFPFHDNKEPLVNAVMIPFPSICDESINVINLLVLLSHGNKAELLYNYSGTENKVRKKGLLDVITQSSMDATMKGWKKAEENLKQMHEELLQEKKDKEKMQEELEKLQEKVEDLKRLLAFKN